MPPSFRYTGGNELTIQPVKFENDPRWSVATLEFETQPRIFSVQNNCPVPKPLFNKAFLNSSAPGQNGSHFAGDIFRCICVNKTLYFTEVGPIDNKPSIGLDNGLAPIRRQAITWTNANPVHRRIYMRHYRVNTGIDAWTKWRTLCGQYFQWIFFKENQFCIQISLQLKFLTQRSPECN